MEINKGLHATRIPGLRYIILQFLYLKLQTSKANRLVCDKSDWNSSPYTHTPNLLVSS